MEMQGTQNSQNSFDKNRKKLEVDFRNWIDTSQFQKCPQISSIQDSVVLNQQTDGIESREQN